MSGSVEGNGEEVSLVTRKASHPFDNAGADIIMRSSDHVDFYVFKTVLILASGFFETLFSLKQPESSKTAALPILDCAEDSATLEALLRFCYPVQNPNVSPSYGQFDRMRNVLEAAMKYEVNGVIDTLQDMLEAHSILWPHAVFAIAAEHRLETLAKSAAVSLRRLLKYDVDKSNAAFNQTAGALVYDPTIAQISAGPYFRLIQCIGSVTSSWDQPIEGLILSPSSGIAGDLAGDSEVDMSTEAPFDRDDSDITLISSDNFSFRVHRLILQFASADTLFKGDSPIYTSMCADTLGTLLRLCYPGTVCSRHLCGISCETLARVASIAISERLEPVVRAMRCNWTRFAETAGDDLGMYLIAARLKWESEAQHMAKKLIDTPIAALYSAQLECTPAVVYHCLLEYHHNCQIAMRDAHAQFERLQRLSHAETLGSGWRRSWFQEISGGYVRTVPLVIAEAHDVRRSFNASVLEHARKRLDAAVVAALDKVNLKL